MTKGAIWISRKKGSWHNKQEQWPEARENIQAKFQRIWTGHCVWNKSKKWSKVERYWTESREWILQVLVIPSMTCFSLEWDGSHCRIFTNGFSKGKTKQNTCYWQIVIWSFQLLCWLGLEMNKDESRETC